MSEPIDARQLRAASLRGFLRLADEVFAKNPQIVSVHLGCSQYYCDEAGDAVHDAVWTSETWRPISSDEYAEDRAPYDLRGQHMSWDENGGAVYAFAALCNEEGWNDEGDDEYREGGMVSPLVSVHRLADGTLRAVWLGALHRPWLDFPEGLADRDDYFGDEEELEFVPDPGMPPLVGREAELYAQVLAEPGNVGVRDVLADVWIMRDDPRGHFTVACRANDRARAAALVLEHGRAWLGSLAAVIPLGGALYAHGPFAEKVVVYADADTLAQHADAREWATIRAIEFAPESARMVTPAMRNLRSVGPIGDAELPQLAGHAIEELDFEGNTALLAGMSVNKLIVRAPGAVDVSRVKTDDIELWLPGTASAAEVAAAFRGSKLPLNAKLVVGVLHGHARAGLVYTGTAIAVHGIDMRLDQASKWSQALDLPLPTTHVPDVDDWLAFGLGVI